MLTADICYISIARGFLYLVAVMDWVSPGRTSSTETTPKKQEDDTIQARQSEEAEQDAADPTHEKEIPSEK